MRFGRYIVGLPVNDKEPLYAPSRKASATMEGPAEANDDTVSDPEDTE